MKGYIKSLRIYPDVFGEVNHPVVMDSGLVDIELQVEDLSEIKDAMQAFGDAKRVEITIKEVDG